MSSRSVVTVVTAALLLGAGAGSASAAEPYEPVFNTERVYVHCGNSDKVQVYIPDLEGGGVGNLRPYLWDTTAPGGSITSGSGCGQIDHNLYRTVSTAPEDGVIFEGTHTGNLDQLTVHASVLRPLYPRHGLASAAHMFMKVSVTVDGTTHSFYASPKTVGGLNGSLNSGFRIDGDLASELDFSVVGLGLLDKDEAGPHDVQIALDYRGWYELSEHDASVIWALDTTDSPSGVTFSPPTLAEQVVTITP